MSPARIVPVGTSRGILAFPAKEGAMLCLLLLFPLLITLPLWLGLGLVEPDTCHRCEPRPRYYLVGYPGHPDPPLPPAGRVVQARK